MQIKFEIDGKPFETDETSALSSRWTAHAGSRRAVIQFHLPVIDIHSYWTPACRTPSETLDWKIELVSAGQRYLPIVSFFNRGGLNRLTFGVTDLIDDCRIIAQMNQEFCRYDISMELTVPEDCDIEFELLLDSAPGSWQDALARCFARFGVKKPDFPDAAWNPVYCTWYAVHAAITEMWTEETAHRAAELGFGTFIVDDGWCFDESRRVTPQTIGTWYEQVGDWRISEKKFPDFDAHLARVKALGLRYLLWVAPFFIGTKSGFYAELGAKEAVSGVRGECGLLNLDCPEGCDRMHKTLIALMERHDLDGLKIDFLDAIPPSVQSPHGRAVVNFVKTLSDGIRAVRPEALIEFREAYATPAMLPYATQFRAGDVPLDWQDNFRRIAEIRLQLGDGVPVHADPAYWHPDELPENISRHMIAALAGVPMLSMDLIGMRDDTKNIVCHWLAFYREHLDTFRSGHWEIFYSGKNLSGAAVSTDKERIVILNDEARAAEFCGPGTVLLNLTSSEIRAPGARVTDCRGLPVSGGIPPGGKGFWK